MDAPLFCAAADAQLVSKKLDLNFVALVIVEKRDETPEKENCENAIPE